MAKKTLTERFIQNSVAERLNKEYYRRKPAWVTTEEYTKLKRADVFLAFMRARKRPYVVVVEAKSRTTIHQLKLKEAPRQTRWAGRAITIVFIVGLSAVLGYQWYFNAVNTLLLLGLFVLGSSLISAVLSKLELSALGSISAIEQLGRYPANEKWIAVGEDTFVRPEEYKTLVDQCKKNGLGLIVVDAKGRLKRKLIPSPRHTFNNYLGNYSKESKILSAIDKPADYGPTPPERAKQRRQLLNATALLAVIGLLGLVSYEENYRPVIPDPFSESYVDLENAEIDSVAVPKPAMPADTGAAAGALEVEEPGPDAEDCSSLSVERRSFIVVDALLNPRNSSKRLAELEGAGIAGFTAIPTDCLNSWPEPGRHAVYLDSVFSHRPAAKRYANAHRDRLNKAGIDFRYGKVVKIRPR
ncbi:hypothetical protein FUA23_13010 [Neolewinella aurantiaca]|uniref:Uncharacterized protein n=1 Tax=Neolewinella aurantiaca TaxID=2602767 RepID=A0A5C7FGL2_9BACT|nr:hypothetical protein [Neolewinella aurantiaca]TXF88765.1 hypothetical protein FUA23_13010 [Neolewinella aurantiaca]